MTDCHCWQVAALSLPPPPSEYFSPKEVVAPKMSITMGPVQAFVETAEHSIAQDLPAEIVGLIFWLAEPQRWCIDWRMGVIGRNVLWVAAQVCAGWRAALLGDRRLWSRSSIDLHSMATRSVSGVLHGALVAQTLFTRSGGLPIDVNLDFSSVDQEDALAIIMDVADRCSSLHLILPLPLYAYFVEKSVHYPILHRLTISTNSKRHHGSPCLALEQFPLLKELNLVWHKHEVWPLPSVHSLTKLDIVTHKLASINLIDLHDLLHGSTTLKDVRLRFEGYFSRWTRSMAIAPHVERLKLEEKATFIQEFMTLPNLRSLFMELPRCSSFLYIGPVEILAHLVKFLDRSECVLEEFTLHANLVLPSQLPPVLQAMPHLRSLELFVHHHPEEVRYVADFFSALCETTAGRNMRMVPFLERLSVCVWAERGADVGILLGGHFVEAVLKRTEAVDSALRYVELAVDGPGTWDLQESDIRILKEREGQVDGLKIVVIDKARARILEMDSDNED